MAAADQARSRHAGSRRRSAPACGTPARRSSSRSTATARTIRPSFRRCSRRWRRAGRASAWSPAQRIGRKATGFKKFQSRIANARARRRCCATARATPAAGSRHSAAIVFLALPYFDGLHRFLPALVRREGYDIGYVDVVDRPRRARHVELRHVGPAVGRHPRSRRRVVADPPPAPRAATSWR